jgi:hypothetical protein
MSVLSAGEDFSCNTLEAVRGSWTKLRYIASLKQPDGSYQHWGLTRKYGEAAAQTAIREAHGQLLAEILRKPLQELRDEAIKEAALCGAASPNEFVSSLMANREALMVSPCTSASVRHFTTILECLESLVPACRDANLQAS